MTTKMETTQVQWLQMAYFFLILHVTLIQLASSQHNAVESDFKEFEDVLKDLESDSTTEVMATTMETMETTSEPETIEFPGIHLKPSDASIGLVGQMIKVQVILDSPYPNQKLVVSSGNRRIFRALTKEVTLTGKSGNGSQAGNLEILLLGLKPGRAHLHVKVGLVRQDKHHFSCLRVCLHRRVKGPTQLFALRLRG